MYQLFWDFLWKWSVFVAEWLSENLYSYIINQSCFSKDVIQGIKQGFKKAEENILIKHYEWEFELPLE